MNTLTWLIWRFNSATWHRRRGKTHGIFVLAPRQCTPGHPPADTPRLGCACARSVRGGRPHRSTPAPGLERRGAAWPGATGWGRGRPARLRPRRRRPHREQAGHRAAAAPPPCPRAGHRAQCAPAAHVRGRAPPVFPRRGGKPSGRPLVAAARSAPRRLALAPRPARAARGPLARWRRAGAAMRWELRPRRRRAGLPPPPAGLPAPRRGVCGTRTRPHGSLCAALTRQGTPGSAASSGPVNAVCGTPKTAGRVAPAACWAANHCLEAGGLPPAPPSARIPHEQHHAGKEIPTTAAAGSCLPRGRHARAVQGRRAVCRASGATGMCEWVVIPGNTMRFTRNPMPLWGEASYDAVWCEQHAPERRCEEKASLQDACVW